MVFRPLHKGKRLPNFYLKGNIGGKTIYRGTGFSKKSMALDAARRMWKTALEGRFDALDGTKLRNEAPCATCGKLMDEFEAQIGNFQPKMRTATKRGYTNALRRILRVVHPGATEKVPGSALSEQLVEKYFGDYVKLANGNLIEIDARIRSANATLRNARGMFSGLALKCYRGLKMPDVAGFMEAATMGSPAVQHEGLSQQAMQAIFRESLWLREENPQLYLVHLLFRHLGMRNDEIMHAKRSWLERRRETVWLPNGEQRRIAGYMVIKQGVDWAPKRGGGAVPIAPEIWAEIRRLCWGMAPGDFLLRARTATERIELVNVAHSEFVRPWVEGAHKTSYELRRWAATAVASRQDEAAAARFLRHAPMTVAGKHYVTRHALVAPISFEDCGL